MDVIDFTISHGNKWPYDAPDSWWQGEDKSEPPQPTDWAHSAARGILADLNDRRGIKRGFENIEEGTRKEIVETIAKIIRATAEKDNQ